MNKTKKIFNKSVLTLAVTAVYFFLIVMLGMTDTTSDVRPDAINISVVSIISDEKPSIAPDAPEQKLPVNLSEERAPTIEAKLSPEAIDLSVVSSVSVAETSIIPNETVRELSTHTALAPLIVPKETADTSKPLVAKRWQLNISDPTAGLTGTSYAENNATQLLNLCLDRYNANCEKRGELVLEGYRTYFENGRLFSRHTQTGEKSKYDGLSRRAAVSILEQKINIP